MLFALFQDTKRASGKILTSRLRKKNDAFYFTDCLCLYIETLHSVTKRNRGKWWQYAKRHQRIGLISSQEGYNS